MEKEISKIFKTQGWGMSSSLKISFATENDIPLILQFIKQLAEYEQLLSEVIAIEEQFLILYVAQ